MSWTRCCFDPLDVIGTSDARNLETGGWGYEGQLFPQAVAGAIRTSVLRAAGFSFGPTGSAEQTDRARRAAEAMGVPGFGGMRRFTFFGPLFRTDADACLFTVPQHLSYSERLGLHVEHMPAECETVFDTGLRGHGQLLRGDEHTRDAEVDNSLCDASELERCLLESTSHTLPHEKPGQPRGGQRELVRLDPGHLRGFERRHGHTRAETGVPQESLLFSRSVARFKDRRTASNWETTGYTGFVSGVDSMDVENCVRLGGDGHLASLRFLAAKDELAKFHSWGQRVIDELPQYGGLILYLATPSVFLHYGWRPESGILNGLALAGAAVGRLQVMAGWDLRAAAPRPPRRVAPAGSVYFLRATMGDVERARDLVRRHHFGFGDSLPMCEDPSLTGLGYGMVFTGVWDTR